METKVSEIQIDMPSSKQTCSICLNDDINTDQMFIVDGCLHMFCSECVKRHIEARLLDGSLIRCPHHGCKKILSLRSCVKLLTPKQRKMWVERIKEYSIPVTDRVYCQNPRCSALMSAIELSKLSGVGVRRWCVQCGEPFCINCKVPWHNDLTCDSYKELNPVPTTNERELQILAREKMWRQCGKCQHMIELSQGCVSVLCRCGHRFCYQCGADNGACSHGHRPFVEEKQIDDRQIDDRDSIRLALCCCFILLLMVALFVVYYMVAVKWLDKVMK